MNDQLKVLGASLKCAYSTPRSGVLLCASGKSFANSIIRTSFFNYVNFLAVSLCYVSFCKSPGYRSKFRILTLIGP